MIQIRPVTDLQNNYNAIEKEVLESDETMYLTKNGYGSMVIISLDKYTALTENFNIAAAEQVNSKREHVEVISRPKRIMDDDE